MRRVKDILVASLSSDVESSTIDDLAFHIQNCLSDLIQLKKLFDYVESNDESALSLLDEGPKRTLIYIAIHASNHLIGAAYLYTKVRLTDQFQVNIFHDEPECPDH